MTIHLQKMENDEHFRRAFMFFDKDGSGYIELDELREALADESGETDNDVLNDIMREVDTDKVHASLSKDEIGIGNLEYSYFFLSFCDAFSDVLSK